MPTYTTTYSLGKPVVGADEDAWGDTLNTSLDAIDDILDGTTPVTGIDINSGTLDGVTIGGTTAGAGTFTTLTANTSITGTLATAAQPNVTSLGTLTSLTVSGDVSFGDNDKAIFGAGSDLQIYHDGFNSYIKDSGTGNLRINAGELTLTNAADNQNRIVTTSDGTVYLYNGGSIKLATTSTGIDVTGTVTADGLTVGANVATGADFYTDANTNFYLTNSGTGNIGVFKIANETSRIVYGQNTTSDKLIFSSRHSAADSSQHVVIDNDGNVGIGNASPSARLEVTGAANSKVAEFTSVGGESRGLAISTFNNGGYDSTGVEYSTQSAAGAHKFSISTTEAMRIDSSGNVGIGTSSPSTLLHISSAGSTVLNVEATGANDSRVRITAGNSNISYVEFADPDDVDTGEIRYNHATNYMGFHTNGNVERMRIDSSGNVGIGTTSPLQALHVNSGTGNSAAIFESTDATSQIWLKDSASSSTYQTGIACYGDNLLLNNGGERMRIDSSGYIISTASNPQISFVDSANSSYKWSIQNTSSAIRFYDNTASSERMRIDSSGNLLVGKSSSNATVEGFEARSSGLMIGTVDSSYPLQLRRLTTDGDIIQFRKDTTTVGSIGVVSGDAYIATGDVGLRFDDGNNILRPVNSSGTDVNGTINLGGPNQRFASAYLSGGVYLGGTGSANYLDDYEFGSYEPTVTATGGGTITLNTAHNSLAYTKIGDVVHVTGLLVVSSVSSPSGRIRITLPYASANLADSAERTWPTAVSYFNGTGASDGAGYYVTGIFLQQGSSYDYVELTPFPRNGAMDLDAADWCGTGSDLQMSLTYFAA